MKCSVEVGRRAEGVLLHLLQGHLCEHGLRIGGRPVLRETSRRWMSVGWGNLPGLHHVSPRISETTRISANGTPDLSTSVVVPGGLPRAIPVSAMPKIHTER
jgi:hypothetical protein